MSVATKTMPRLQALYESEIRSAIQKEFSIENEMAVPKVQKIVINMGVGEAKENKELLKMAFVHLMTLAGQKPVVTKARRSVAGFKLREGMNIGLKVTLRRDRMWEFLDRLISLAVPRIRDFRGLSRTAFDGRGNYSMGLSEQSVFPEIDLDTVKSVVGMTVTIVTSAKTDAESEALLKGFGMPFKRDGES